MMDQYDQAAKDSLPGVMRQVLSAWMRDEVEDMLPAVVISYDLDTNRAVLRPLVQLGMQDGRKISRPPQVNVSVFRFGAGGFFINVPIKPGDLGWIKANDRDISLVMQRQGQEDWPNTTRTHDFNDAMFFPDVLFGGEVAAENADALTIQSLDGSVCVAVADGGVTITAPTVTVVAPLTEVTGNLHITGNLDITGTTIGNGINLNTHRHTGVDPGVGTSGGPVP